MEPLIMVNEAAKILGRSPSAVRVYVTEKKLRALRTNRGVRLFRRSEVEKLARELRDKETAQRDSRGYAAASTDDG